MKTLKETIQEMPLSVRKDLGYIDGFMELCIYVAEATIEALEVGYVEPISEGERQKGFKTGWNMCKRATAENAQKFLSNSPSINRQTDTKTNTDQGGDYQDKGRSSDVKMPNYVEERDSIELGQSSEPSEKERLLMNKIHSMRDENDYISTQDIMNLVKEEQSSEPLGEYYSVPMTKERQKSSASAPHSFREVSPTRNYCISCGQSWNPQTESAPMECEGWNKQSKPTTPQEEECEHDFTFGGDNTACTKCGVYARDIPRPECEHSFKVDGSAVCTRCGKHSDEIYVTPSLHDSECEHEWVRFGNNYACKECDSVKIQPEDPCRQCEHGQTGIHSSEDVPRKDQAHSLREIEHTGNRYHDTTNIIKTVNALVRWAKGEGE